MRRARTRLPAVAEGAFRLLATIAAEHQALTQRIAALPPHAGAAGGRGAGPARRAGPSRILSAPRRGRSSPICRAISRRSTAASPSIREDPARDARHAGSRCVRWWQRYRDRARRATGRSGASSRRSTRFRWLLEELTVSLFAQELKTPFPVSYKRVERAWAELCPLTDDASRSVGIPNAARATVTWLIFVQSVSSVRTGASAAVGSASGRAGLSGAGNARQQRDQRERTDRPNRRPDGPCRAKLSKILGDCRDLAIHRLLLSFTAMLDRVGDMLMDRASRTDVREEQQYALDARDALQAASAPALMAEFERRLRTPDRRPHRREGRGQGRFLEGRRRQADARRHGGDGRVGGHGQHHARRREPLPRRAAAAEPRRRPPARAARPRDRRQSVRARARSSTRLRRRCRPSRRSTGSSSRS